MINHDLGMMALSFLIGGFMLGRPGWLSLVFSLIPLIYGVMKFNDVRSKLSQKTDSEGKS